MLGFDSKSRPDGYLFLKCKLVLNVTTCDANCLHSTLLTAQGHRPFAGEGVEPKRLRVEERERAQQEAVRRRAQLVARERAIELERERRLAEVRANTNMMHVLVHESLCAGLYTPEHIL
jgi:hypothetical protein